MEAGLGDTNLGAGGVFKNRGIATCECVTVLSHSCRGATCLAQSGGEGVSDQLDVPVVSVGSDGYDVETAGLAGRNAACQQVVACHGDDLPLLPMIDRFERVPGIGFRSRSHFDENEFIAVCRNDVEFTRTCPEVALDDSIAMLLQILHGKLFSQSAEALAAVGTFGGISG